MVKFKKKEVLQKINHSVIDTRLDNFWINLTVTLEAKSLAEAFGNHNT